jgi:hypothetical protein
MKAMHSLAAVVALSSFALGAQALEARFDAVPPQSIAIGEITIGDTLAAKSNEYGEREVARLVEVLRGDLERQLGRIGRLAAEPAGAEATLHVVIEDALPNRPTPQQQTVGPRPRDPRGGAGPMDPRTIMLGGAELSATLADQGGAEIGRFAYSWRTRPDVRLSQELVTWSDARRTFDRFSRRLADAIAGQSS